LLNLLIFPEPAAVVDDGKRGQKRKLEDVVTEDDETENEDDRAKNVSIFVGGLLKDGTASDEPTPKRVTFSLGSERMVLAENRPIH
jgi:hypothetical protein